MSIRIRNGLVVTVGVLLGLLSLGVASAEQGMGWLTALAASIPVLFLASGVAMLRPSWRGWGMWLLLLMGVCGLVMCIYGIALELPAVQGDRHAAAVRGLTLFALFPVYGLGVGISMLLTRRKLPDGHAPR